MTDSRIRYPIRSAIVGAIVVILLAGGLDVVSGSTSVTDAPRVTAIQKVAWDSCIECWAPDALASGTCRAE